MNNIETNYKMNTKSIDTALFNLEKFLFFIEIESNITTRTIRADNLYFYNFNFSS